MKKFIILFIIFYLTQVFCASWYVSVVGQDKSGYGTTASKGFKTLNYALNQSTSGDEIFIIPGLYSGLDNTGITIDVDRLSSITISQMSNLDTPEFRCKSTDSVGWSFISSGKVDPSKINIVINGIDISSCYNALYFDFPKGGSVVLTAGSIVDTQIYDVKFGDGPINMNVGTMSFQSCGITFYYNGVSSDFVLTLDQSIIQCAKGGSYGTGFWQTGGSLSVSNTQFIGLGSQVMVVQSIDLNIDSSTFSQCPNTNGSPLSLYQTNAVITSSSFNSNGGSNGNGGVISFDAPDQDSEDYSLSISTSVFSKNSGYHGGVLDIGTGSVLLYNNTFSENTAQYTGSVGNLGGDTATNSYQNIYQGNKAIYSCGSPFYCSFDNLIKDYKSTFIGNTESSGCVDRCNLNQTNTMF